MARERQREKGGEGTGEEGKEGEKQASQKPSLVKSNGIVNFLKGLESNGTQRSNRREAESGQLRGPKALNS